MAEKPAYNEKHCKKHNQGYADYLRECPICAGEKTGEDYKEETKKIDAVLAKLR